MAHKLRNSRGLTLVEMLCAVMILVLLGLLINTGLHMAVKSYQNITAQSELELLLSTLGDTLADDLRYAREVTTEADGTVATYYSDRYNGATKLSVNTDDDKYHGQVYANNFRVLPGGAYGNGAYVVPPDGLTITFDESKRLFTINLTVCQAGGTISAHTEFTVRCLNPKT